jgi:DNA-binding NarL/FixJ family response regulator
MARRTCDLSPREIEIIELIAIGDMHKQIAGKLGISHRTVSIHAINIAKALGARTMTHAVAIWMRRKIEAEFAELACASDLDAKSPERIAFEAAR